VPIRRRLDGLLPIFPGLEMVPDSIFFCGEGSWEGLRLEGGCWRCEVRGCYLRTPMSWLKLSMALPNQDPLLAVPRLPLGGYSGLDESS
jgi:hypothetical protein